MRRGGMDVTQTLWILVAVSLGITQALQVAMLGAMSQHRGPYESTLTSIIGTLCGVTAALTIRSLLGTRPLLPPPMASPLATGAIAVAAGVVLALVLRGLPLWFGITGLLAVPYLLAASYLAPRLGVGLFLAAIITGQLTGAVIFDHVGAFGLTPRPVDAMRLLGVAALLVGVVLVKGTK